MDVYQNIWSNCNAKHIKKHDYLIKDAVLSLGLFQNESVRLLDSHVREVNSLINSTKTRERGLRLLVDLASQCPQQVVAAQGERWFRFCVQAISSAQLSTRSAVNACQVLTTLLRDLPSLPELQRFVVSKYIKYLVTTLASAHSTWSHAGLECLYEYLKAAPGQCLVHKTELENQILKHLDTPLTRPGQRDTVALAGQVFSALPMPGIGVGNNAAQGRAEAMGRQLTHLLALAHSLMDTLLEGVVEKESYEHVREHSLPIRPLEEVAEDPISNRLAVVTRLANTLRFAGELLTADANTAITVIPENLLSVVFRILQVEVSVLRKYRSQEHKLLAFCLPSLHHHCLIFLQDVLLSIGDGVDAYFGMLLDLLVSVLKSRQPAGTTGPEWCTGGQKTRIIAYTVLATLIQVSQGRHALPPDLVTMVLQDVTPKEYQFKLQKQDKGLASLSVQKAKSKKKGYTVTSANTSSREGPLPRLEHFSCLARVALAVAEAMFTYAGHSLAYQDHQHLQRNLLSLTAAVLGSGAPQDIYTDGRTRAQLFHTLSSAATNPQPRCPMPYSLLLHLLQAGLSDSDPQVVSACQVALGSVSLIVANPAIASAFQAYHQQLPHITTQDNKEDEVDIVTQEGEKQEKEMEEEEEEEKGVEEEEEEEEDDTFERSIPSGFETETTDESLKLQLCDDEWDDESPESQLEEEKGYVKEKELEETKIDARFDENSSSNLGNTVPPLNRLDNITSVPLQCQTGGKIESAASIHHDTRTSSKESEKDDISNPPAKKRKKSDSEVNSDTEFPSVEKMLEDFVDSDADD